MRRRLELYFERRNCLAPDELADETLNRVARRLEEEGSIAADCPAQFCYVIAKFVFQESLRRTNTLVELPPDAPLATAPQVETNEHVLACLDDCLQSLAAADRELIVEYYRGEQRAKIEQRRALAARLGVSTNALTIRACRLREKLERSLKERLSER
ncbi:MAG TPA: hypothetical protein VF980_19890 [Thermoanaerobaculia bacterium]